MLPRVLDAAGVRRAHPDRPFRRRLDRRHLRRQPAGFPGPGLVLIAPHFFVEDQSASPASKPQATPTTEGDLRAGAWRAITATSTCAFWGWNGAWLDPAFRAWRIDDHSPISACRSCCVQGDADPYGTTAQLSAAES